MSISVHSHSTIICRNRHTTAGTPVHTNFAPVHGYGACTTPCSAGTPPCTRIFPPVAGYGVCTTPYGITDSDINDNHPGTHKSVRPGRHQVRPHFASQGGCIHIFRFTPTSTVHSPYCIYSASVELCHKVRKTSQWYM
jgi:hypothetical protein